MNRREFIAGLGTAAAWPLATHAQQGDRVRRIGVLVPYDENDPEGRLPRTGPVCPSKRTRPWRAKTRALFSKVEFFV
jgi:hypothetical protein